MGKVLSKLSEKDFEWLNNQKIFFVASAPAGDTGHVNCSPKGGDCFRFIDPMTFVYADYTGSGAETAAHLQQNKRLCIMFCALEGPPKIMRLHGLGEIVLKHHSDYAQLENLFPERVGTRCFIRLRISRISTSCGYQVPLFQYQGERDVLLNWENKQGADGLKNYRQKKNSQSIDGLKIPEFD